MTHKEYNLTIQALFIFIGKLIQILFQFLVPVVLIRIFSQSDYGTYQKVLFVTAILIPLFRFHLTDSLFYFFPILEKSKERNELISQTYFQLLTICFFVSLLILIVLPFLNSFFEDVVFFKYKYQILGIVFFSVSSSILENIFILEKKSKFLVKFASIDKFVRTCLLIYIGFYFKTIESALLAIIIHGLLRFIFLTSYLLKFYKLNLLHVKIEKLKKQWSYVLPMGIGIFVGVIGKNTDKLILVWLLTDSDFALYSIGNLSVPFIATVYVSIGNVVMPELAKYSIKKDFKRTLQLWKSMVIKNSIVTLPIIFFFIIEAKELFIFLFTESYADSANVFRVIVLTLLIQMLGYGYVLRAFGKTKKILVAKVYRTILSLIVGYILIINFGIIGAAVTSVFSFFINAIIQLISAKKMLQVTWLDYLPWKHFAKLILISTFPGIIIICINTLGYTPIKTLIINSFIYFSLITYLLYRFSYFKVFGTDKIFKQLKLK